MAQMTEIELNTLLSNAIEDSVIFNGEFSENAKESLRYYLGEKLGDEVEGRSQVVSMDCQDVVEADMPSLVRTFLGSSDILNFEAITDSDEDLKEAEEKTKYINFLVRQQKDSFKVIHDWMKNAEIQDISVVKAFIDDQRKVTEEKYESVTFEEVIAIEETLNGEGVSKVEIISRTEPDEEGLFDITFKVTTGRSKVCIKNIPPESFLISRNAETADEAQLIGDRVRKTRGELLAEGFPRDLIDQLPQVDTEAQRDTQLRQERFKTEGGYDSDSYIKNWASENVEIYDLYPFIDFDGDGIAERRHVMMSGNHVLINEYMEKHPYSCLSAISMPHKAIGRSRVEITKQTQLVKTAMLRQTLDNVYMVNNPRIAANDNVDIDDLLTVRPNGIVRVDGEQNPGQAMFPVEIPYIGDKSLQIIQYLDNARANTTGSLMANQGLDADTMAKETATRFQGVQEIGAAKVELVARVFAETGFKNLYEYLAWLTMHYQDDEMEIRVLGKQLTINPSAWKYEQAAVVEVGLAVGDNEDTLQSLGFIYQQQLTLMQMGSPLVDQKKIYNTIARMSKVSGIAQTDKYFNDPEQPDEMLLAENEILRNAVAQLQQVAQNNPLAEAEQIKQEAEMIRKTADFASKQAEQAEKARQFDVNTMADMKKHVDEMALKMADIEAKTNTQQDANVQQNMLIFDPETGNFVSANS